MTQQQHEKNLVSMWDAKTDMSTSMLIGYSYACARMLNDWHQDCMFLIDVLKAKRDLDNTVT